MPQHPKLRKKKIGGTAYWFTKAGGETYFGNVADVTYTEAKELFSDHIQSLANRQKDAKRTKLTAGELMDLFLDWLKKNRSDRTYLTRKTYCCRFGSFRVSGQKVRIADLPANKIKGADLQAWLDHLEEELDLSAQTRRHAETSIKHCWNWATKHPSPTPYLSPIYRPFSSIEQVYVPPKTLTETALMTDKEALVLFDAASVDLDQFHRFGPKTPRVFNPYDGFADLLKCYYHTGARTDELARCEVGDLLSKTRQVILGRHKRSKTQRNPTIRHITLNAEAFETFKRNCLGKQEGDRVFLNSDRRPWDRSSIAKRFARVKEVAAKLKIGKVRKEITVYDFRHLWISEMLMAGNDISTVARMAGTSISMIERVYGHFRNSHLREAQQRLDDARMVRALPLKSKAKSVV